MYSLAEPFIKPTLRIKPSSNITEGKEIQFECSTVVAKMHDIEIILLRNKTILSSVRDQTTLKYSTVATLEDSGEYLCKVEEGKASKIATRNVVVAGNSSVHLRFYSVEQYLNLVACKSNVQIQK